MLLTIKCTTHKATEIIKDQKKIDKLISNISNSLFNEFDADIQESHIHVLLTDYFTIEPETLAFRVSNKIESMKKVCYDSIRNTILYYIVTEINKSRFEKSFSYEIYINRKQQVLDVVLAIKELTKIEKEKIKLHCKYIKNFEPYLKICETCGVEGDSFEVVHTSIKQSKIICSNCYLN